MRDDDHRAVEAGEERLEPREPGEVEVVRRLVEQQHVEAAEEDRRERGARGLSAGEALRADGRAATPSPSSASACRARASRSPPPRARNASSASVYAAGQAGLVAKTRGERVHSPLGPADAGAAREIRAQRLARARVALLRQIADRERRACADRCRVRRVAPGEQAQERRLPAPFGPTRPIRARGGTTRSTSRENDVGTV